MAITGLGIRSPIGCGAEACLDCLCAGGSGLRVPEDPRLVDLGVPGVGRIAGCTAPAAGRVDELALGAALAALEDAGLHAHRLPEDAVICISNSKGPVPALEMALHEAGRSPSRLDELAACSSAARVACELRFGGRVFTRTAACATGLVSVLAAASEVASGRASVALAGASESSLTPFMHAAFGAMGALAPSGDRGPEHSIRPFDEERCGFLLGEGAAGLVIEPLEVALGRGKRPWALLAGWAEQCEAYDIARPNPDGEAELRAARLAVERAGLVPEELGGIWLHGTATGRGDPAELAAMRELCGPVSGEVPATASKGATGHLLGASGAVELALACLCRRERLLPAVRNLSRPLASGALRLVQETSVATSGQAYLVVSAGFGGHCAAAVLVEPPS